MNISIAEDIFVELAISAFEVREGDEDAIVAIGANIVESFGVGIIFIITVYITVICVADLWGVDAWQDAVDDVCVG